MIKTIVIIFIVFYNGALFATPKSVEVWFVSNPKTTFLDSLLKQDAYKFSKPFVENDSSCVKVDGGCFNPQTGFVPEDENKPIVNREESSKSLKTFKGRDATLIDCDKGYYFDLYCGKEKNSPKKFAETGIWIDVSSSLSEFDYSKHGKFCHRRTFVEKIQKKCGKKVSISIYDTSIKQLGTLDSLCQSRGLNDTKRLINWIKSSTYGKLIIVTDIREYSGEFSNFILSIGGLFKGELGTISASTLDSLASKVQCR